MTLPGKILQVTLGKNKFSNSRVGQGSTEMLLDVSLQDRVEMLKFSVSNQSNDKHLKKTA